MSDAAFTDSTTAQALPASTRSPTFGSSTYTRSPSRPWAWSEMPTVTLPSPSTRVHSWDFRNFRSPGISLMGYSAATGGGWKGNSLTTGRKPLGGPLPDTSGQHAVLRLAVTHEREFHHPHRHLAAADIDPDVTFGAQRDRAGRHP